MVFSQSTTTPPRVLAERADRLFVFQGETVNTLEVRQQLGFAVTPNALCRSKTAKGSQKLIYTLLASYTDENKESYPSMNTLAELSEMSKATVAKAIKALSLAGWVSVRKERKGESFKNVYHLSMVPTGTVESIHGTGELFSTVPTGTG